jgi:hypothetical protein
MQHIDDGDPVEGLVDERNAIAVIDRHRNGRLRAQQHIDALEVELGLQRHDRLRDRAVAAADVEHCFSAFDLVCEMPRQDAHAPLENGYIMNTIQDLLVNTHLGSGRWQGNAPLLSRRVDIRLQHKN